MSSQEHRTRIDWAEEVKQLLDEDYPYARKVKRLCDNLMMPQSSCVAFSLNQHFKLAKLVVSPELKNQMQELLMTAT